MYPWVRKRYIAKKTKETENRTEASLEYFQIVNASKLKIGDVHIESKDVEVQVVF